MSDHTTGILSVFFGVIAAVAGVISLVLFTMGAYLVPDLYRIWAYAPGYIFASVAALCALVALAGYLFERGR